MYIKKTTNKINPISLFKKYLLVIDTYSITYLKNFLFISVFLYLMEKALIIISNPKKDSTTHSICDLYEKFSKKKCEIIDLYDKKNKLDFLDFRKRNRDKIESFQDKIKSSTEIVFIFPIWNGSEPAILKNFWDQVFESGFSFKYENKKHRPLLNKQKVKILVTCDAPKIFFLINYLKCMWKFLRVKYSGMKLDKFFYFDKIYLRKKNREKFEKYLERNVKKLT